MYMYVHAVTSVYYLSIHVIFERLETVTILNIWRVIRSDPRASKAIATSITAVNSENARRFTGAAGSFDNYRKLSI